MKGKFLTTLFFLLVLSRASFAQFASLELDSSESSFNIISEGEIFNTNLIVKNVGTQDLYIERIISDCGCLITGEYKNPIIPKGQIVIPIKFDSSGLSGDQSRSLVIYSNDPDKRIVNFYLIGKVSPKISIKPEALLFKLPEQDSIDLQISSSVYQFSDLFTKNKWIKIEKINANTSNISARVSINPDLPFGEYSDRIILKLNDQKDAYRSIPVRISKKPDLIFDPQILSLGLINSELTTYKINLSSISGKIFKIKDFKISSDALTAKAKFNTDLKRHEIDLTVDGKLIKNDLRTALVVYTDHPEFAEIAISIYGVKSD